MPVYNPPLRDMQFVMHEVLKVTDDFKAIPQHAETDADTINAVLEEAGKFASQVIFPLNISGDTEGCKLDQKTHEVTTPKGFKEAYKTYVDGGWAALSCDPEFGGQGLPLVVNQCLYEMMNSANQAWTMYPGLTHGAYAALHTYGTDEQKKTYLPKMTSGEWTGTMCLTEPHCGTDLGLMRTKAEPLPDGTYKLTGNKIFISAGEHDMAENIVHLVLARLPDAPEGVKGISLFIVPKFMVNADGSLGARNDVRCVSLEHKLGIHASPTCTLAFGDNGGAVGYLVGEANKGLQYMFAMMNNARLNVGLQGIGVAEHASQQAAAFAMERKQGGTPQGAEATIMGHPDIRRMLGLMKSRTEAARVLAYRAAASLDHAHRSPDAEARAFHQRRVDLLIPIAKGWSTELGVSSASLGVQVHGGMGFVEETGAAQHLRDARITTIYEGTTGMQAQDVLFRRLLKDGATIRAALTARLEGDAVFPALLARLDTLVERLSGAEPQAQALAADAALRAAWEVVAAGLAERLLGSLGPSTALDLWLSGAAARMGLAEAGVDWALTVSDR